VHLFFGIDDFIQSHPVWSQNIDSVKFLAGFQDIFAGNRLKNPDGYCQSGIARVMLVLNEEEANKNATLIFDVELLEIV